MLPRLAATFALTLFLSPLAASPVLAQTTTSEQDMVSPAHVALVDGVASLEREGRTENPLNMPLLSGDRLKTADGRVEVVFADGSTLHLDRSTTIDVQSDDLIRLIDGRVRLNIPGASRTIAYRIDSASGSVRIRESGEYRVAVLHGTDETQLELAVLRGAGEIFTDQGNTAVRAGERAYASAGLAPSYTYAYNSANWDAFDRWSEQRRDARLGVSTQYLASDMQQYASTFDQYGDWRYAQPYGYVWYPRVATDWRPYYYGRWMAYPRYGWTWVGADHFAWPTHHYGRWGFSSGAWFWIPGNHWGPAWVSWGYANNFVSWCPLGFNNLPVISVNFFNYGPHYHYAGYHYYPAWTVVSRSHFGHGWVHDRAVNWWDGNGRGRGSFTSAQVSPVNPNVAVPRGSVPVHWAGTSRSAVIAPAVARSQPGVAAVTRGSTSVTGPRDVAVPRYVNRGDQIIRSQTERSSAPGPSDLTRRVGAATVLPGERDGRTRVDGVGGNEAVSRTPVGAPATGEAAVSRRVAGPAPSGAVDRNRGGAIGLSETGGSRRVDGPATIGQARDAAVPRYAIGARTMPSGPARRIDDPIQPAVPSSERAVPRSSIGAPSPSYAPRYNPGSIPDMRSAPGPRAPDAGGMAVPRSSPASPGGYGVRSYAPRPPEASGAREAGPAGGVGHAVERSATPQPRQGAPSSAPAPSRGGGSAAPAPQAPSGGGSVAAPRRGGRGGQ